MSRRINVFIPFLLPVAILLSSCGGIDPGNNKGDNLQDKQYREGITVSNNVKIPKAEFIKAESEFDRNGNKKIYVLGKKTESFEVVDSDTGAVVLTGKVRYRPDESKEADEYLGECDLSSLTRADSYYLRTEDGECSEEFRIEKDMYKGLLADRISYFGESESIPVNYTYGNIRSCFLRITDCLLAQEFFPESIQPEDTKDTVIVPRTILIAKGEIDRLKDYINEKGVLKATLRADTGCYYQYSAVMALFAYEYDSYDKEYAGKCRDIAIRAYDHAQKEYDELDFSGKKQADDKRYWASAQLYKLTGVNGYRETAQSYVTGVLPKGFSEDKSGFLGTIAYLTCYNKIDLNIGEELITSILDDINSVVSDSSREDYYDIKENTDEDEFIKRIYENARLIVLGNYITKNYKYVETAEDHLAFLYGRNLLGNDYAYDRDSAYYAEPQMYILAGLIDTYLYEDKEPEAMNRE